MQEKLKDFFLGVFIVLVLSTFYLIVRWQQELSHLDQLEKNLAATSQLNTKAVTNQLSARTISQAENFDPDDDWAQESLGVPAVRDYFASHPEIGLAKVAIVDSGINASHEEFVGQNIALAPSGAGCENGPGNDLSGHGTASAGLVTGLWFNGRGSYGVGSFPLFICRSNTTAEDVVASLLNAAVDWGAKVVLLNRWDNFALDVNDQLYLALQTAAQSGVAVVVPSGNNYSTSLVNDISGHPNVFAVGAHDQFGRRRPFSDYESNPTFKQIDFLVPGGEIVVPWRPVSGQNNLYRWFGGTSSAAPLAAGALATIFSLKPDLTLAEAKTVLCFGATDHDNNPADGDEDGCGNLNLARSLTHPLLGLTNLPPYFTNVPLGWHPITRGGAYQFDFQTLGEGSGVIYGVVNAPAGAQINPNSGVFSFTPSTEGPAQVLPLIVRAVGAQSEAVYRGKLLIAGTASLPFSDDLENKEVPQFQPWWRMITNDSGRIRIDSKDSLGVADSPSYLELSRWGDSAFGNGLAAADLEFKIEHAGNLVIDFDHLVLATGHQINTLLPNGAGSLNLNDETNWGDGLAFSLDGVTWYRAADLSAVTYVVTPEGQKNDWVHVTVNLTELLTQFDLTLGDKLYLRFANYAERNTLGVNADRLLLDNVSLNWQS